VAYLTLGFGKYKGAELKKRGRVPRYYLQWISDNLSGDLQTAASELLEGREYTPRPGDWAQKRPEKAVDEAVLESILCSAEDFLPDTT
jgi:hypothetical protein